MLTLVEHLRHYINLISESIFSRGINFSDEELYFTEKYGWSILEFLEKLNSQYCSDQDSKEIKEYLETFLSDGGFWGETGNAQHHSNTDLKYKIIQLKDSI
jgi:hypothetical protein